MTPGDRPASWQLLVLAYVDGELDPVSQIEVEAWMRTQPEVAALVRELRATGRAHFARPDPEPIDLHRSGEMILARLRPQMPSRGRAWLRPALLAAVAASMAGVLFLACPPEHVCQSVVGAPAAPPPPVDPLAEYADLPIASLGEARVSAVRGDVSPTFVGRDELLPDLLELAHVDDVQIARTGRGAYSVPSAGDAPMIFQTRAAR